MHYAYILQSEKDNTRYFGSTSNLKKRLQQHNSGAVRYTSAKIPYKIIWYAAFVSKEKAMGFEKYLKSSSGHAFMKKRLA